MAKYQLAKKVAATILAGTLAVSSVFGTALLGNVSSVDCNL